jgi:hypothetical protein
VDPEVDCIKGRQRAPIVTFCALVERRQEPLPSHCTTFRGEARTTNITIHDWQHDRKRCDADFQDEVVIMSSVLMSSLKQREKYTGCPKKIVPFSKILLWAPRGGRIFYTVYQKLGNKSKFFLPHKDSIWAPCVTRQISRR